MLELDTTKLTVLGLVAFYFCGIFLSLSFVAAILLQGAHEVFRKWFNRLALDSWLRHRHPPLISEQMLLELPAIGSGLFSLPYWQLTGQIGALASSQLTPDPKSKLVLALANASETDFSSRDLPYTSTESDSMRETRILRELTVRMQAGINSLHAHLRNFWNTFDYVGSFYIVVMIASLLTTLKETQGQRYLLYAICFFAWFATPILRRMIERLVPFR